MSRMLQRVVTSDRGFTLIELLVVVAILGVISSVVVLNIGGFMRTGVVQAANTEMHQVQTAVVAHMAARSLSTWDGTLGPDSSSGPGGHPVDYLMNPGTLQASYDISGGGITGATKRPDSKWTDVEFVDGQWQPV